MKGDGRETSRPEPFPFERAMRFGFGVLRLSPDAFWRMTPRELHCALCAVYGDRPAAPSRDGLAALMRAFPDDARQR